MNIKILIFFTLFVFPWAAGLAKEPTPNTLEDGIRQLAEDIATQMKERDIKKIAIDDFTDLNGYKSALGDFISEELVTNFYTQGLGNFDVVERRELARVLKEQKLGRSGLLNTETIAKVGEILGTEAIVTGSIAYLGPNIKINARMIGVDDAKIFAAAARKIQKDQTVEELLRQSARPRSSMSSPAPAAGLQVQRQDVYFQNRFLHVSPKAISKSKDKRSISIALQFKNLVDDRLYLGVKEDNPGRPSISMISNAGERLIIEKYTGLSRIYTPWERQTKKVDYTMISANSQVTVVFIFESREEIDGNIFSFNTDLFRYKGGKGYTRFSVGIPNMELN